MSAGYTWVQWNRAKIVYDAAAAIGVVVFIAIYAGVSMSLRPDPNAISDEIIIIRALGACAMTLLTLILCIGPLARLLPRFLPILYNRRHLGVMTFLLALAHGALSLGFYHGFGTLNPLVSLLVNAGSPASLSGFPYQWLGVVGLAVLFVLAATSHDFWLKNLGPAAWKWLHMCVYPAYAALVAHVLLGAFQNERGVALPALACGSVLLVCGLHIAAGLKERRADRGREDVGGGWIDAGPAAEIPKDRARIVCAAGGERIAVFRVGERLHAVTNLCAHQGGPLGEGRVIDGCITCPWHGWQYKPTDGCSPPPFEEKIATYQVRVVAGRAQVHAQPLPAGTQTKGASITDEEGAA